MKAVILDATHSPKPETDFSTKLAGELKNNGIETTTIKIWDLNLLPCYGCEGCLRKTPGRCIMKDDTEKFMVPLAKTNCIIGITDVRYGGYSSQYKLVVDKFALLGSPYYGMKNGKLLHKKRYHDLNAYYTIGLGNELSVDEIENFTRLVKRNAMNMFIDYYGAFTAENETYELVMKELVGKVMNDGR